MTVPMIDPVADYARLEQTLCNRSGQVPLHERFRALFVLKNLKTPQAVDVIAKAFDDSSALLKHELAYVLGQIKDKCALPCLRQVLADKTQDPMVRHEAAEAMGAIGCPSSVDVLQQYYQDTEECAEVRETCELALARIHYEQQPDACPTFAKDPKSAFASVDPAPPLANDAQQSVAELERILLDDRLPLFQRYGAMFSLRNRGGKEAVLALAKGFGDKSALFRHEIAYVFGQMQDQHSVEALKEVLANAKESPMVRHECAEALGSIASEDCLPMLEQFRSDKEQVVRDSCIVALDMYDYETQNEFQYANTLTK